MCFILWANLWPALLGIHTGETLMLKEPALSETHIAFIYADDLWVSQRDGSSPRQITTDDGVESQPVFSPDGSIIAFSGEYDGNTDVFIVPTEGGNPTRLTWHPADDYVSDFTADGKNVLFDSGRNTHTRRFTKLLNISILGGMPEELPVPSGNYAQADDSGRFIAYLPVREVFREWKNYRGGTHSRIWIMDQQSLEVAIVDQPETRCNDTYPAWVGEDLYFLSDRDGEFNLYVSRKGLVEKLTDFEDFPILSLKAHGQSLVFEQAGKLHIWDVQSAQSTTLSIHLAADLIATRPRFVNAGEMIRNAHISPSGARAVFEARGEIVTVPVKNGHARVLSQSTGSHEREPAWSPDGKKIAYVSDKTGEYQLIVQNQDGSGKARAYDLEGHGFYEALKWSPNNAYIAYRDNSRSLYVIELASGTCHKVNQEPYYGPFITLSFDWSPDSNWLVHTISENALMQTVFVHDLKSRKNHKLTDGMSNASEPVFDVSGKYLYFLASTDAGPLNDWFAMSNSDRTLSYSIYAIVLSNETASPLAPESDEEMSAESEPLAAKETSKKDKKTAEGEKKEPPQVTRIDFENLENRIIALPVPAGAYSSLSSGEEGVVYYLFTDPNEDSGSTLRSFSFKDKKVEDIGSGVITYMLSADRKKILFSSGPRRNPSWSISDAAKLDPSKEKLNTHIEIKIDPRTEWSQIFDESWRINRDYFYATNFHGVDWAAMKARYQPFLQHAASRSDVNRIIQWMCSELAVGHHRSGGGDTFNNPDKVPGGLLGADFEVDKGRYRFSRVFDGLNWNPELKSPLSVPGVQIRDGEYLLAVNDQEVVPPANLYSFFENTAGKTVRLKVAATADGSKAREVVVEPINDESALRNRAWVEDNIKRVDEATGGRVAYVWLPNTAGLGHTYFKRYFYPQAHKDAIILDERYNGGGQIADYYIDVLRRKPVSYWATRYGKDLFTPTGSIQGPKVMIIDENAGSGGDLLPWMFRKYQMGPLVGKATWGGLVGVLGFPRLMDGGFVSAPNIAIFTEDGWVVENVGVPPDVEVEQWPKETAKGKDPQLEKAIELALEALKDHPPTHVERPPFPVRNE